MNGQILENANAIREVISGMTAQINDLAFFGVLRSTRRSSAYSANVRCSGQAA